MFFGPGGRFWGPGRWCVGYPLSLCRLGYAFKFNLTYLRAIPGLFHVWLVFVIHSLDISLLQVTYDVIPIRAFPRYILGILISLHEISGWRACTRTWKYTRVSGCKDQPRQLQRGLLQESHNHPHGQLRDVTYRYSSDESWIDIFLITRISGRYAEGCLVGLRPIS